MLHMFIAALLPGCTTRFRVFVTAIVSNTLDASSQPAAIKQNHFWYAFGVYTCYASHYSLLMLPSSFEYCPLQGESEDAPLHIGGLRIHCEGDSGFEIAGNRRQKASDAFDCPV